QGVPDFLPIDFIVIGGGIAGLTASISLSRVGHRVTLLEQKWDFDETQLAGGCRIAPNITRILSRWGLNDELRAITSVGHFVQFVDFVTGECAAKGEWVDDFRIESDGEFLLAHYADFRRLLYDTAVRYGTTVRANARVVKISVTPEHSTVVLECGETLSADVLIGADGSHSISRATILGRKTPIVRKHLNMYNATISIHDMAAEPTLAPLLADKIGIVLSWFGNGCGAIGFQTMRDEYHVQIYLPEDPRTAQLPFPISAVERDTLIASLGKCEPRIKRLAELAQWVLALPVVDIPHLEDPLHDDGPLLVIGEAAHPFPVGSIYTIGLAACDGMMLGRLFSHLRRRRQIPGFLDALAEMRRKRVAQVYEIQLSNPAAMSVPPGVDMEYTDALRAAQGMGDSLAEALTQDVHFCVLQAIREVFAYDPEDEAEDWWVQWGLVHERALAIEDEQPGE
ncbi:FAD/NAD(P)-binding domain-containing protein, partial [Wolfiporia cocos MD-104 SS10]